MNIIPLAIPTPFYVGDVNVYLIREDPVTLIDVGPKTKEAAEALRYQLAQHGVSFADVRRIVLTHAHEDHCGLAKSVRDEAKDALVLIHAWETGHLFGRLAQEHQQNLLVRAGVPHDVISEMRSLYESISLLTDSLEDGGFEDLKDEMELDFESGSLRVLHTPGHTPGSCSFVREANRTLYCGDCVLKRITPNPILSPDPIDRDRRFPSLAEYLVSLAKLRSYKPTMTYGGHGEPITDFEEIFFRYIRAIDERQKRVISLVESGGSTAFDVARRLFPNSFNHDVHRFLAISEAAAHLDLAGSEGKLNVKLTQGVENYLPI
ncbi:MAG TPA: MBL fold metallo-hydrolase [Pyrinomonadaceae bacterium]|nr:MBL fold metallo-hydrolase [Pyrinomonadaceae bacterium]HMP65385.1 MBL fold metallo-hydrolase [Pyrinomonadaceae bacterium]